MYRLTLTLALAAMACGEPKKCLETRYVQHEAYSTIEYDFIMATATGVPMMRPVYHSAWTETVCVRFEEAPR